MAPGTARTWRAPRWIHALAVLTVVGTYLGRGAFVRDTVTDSLLAAHVQAHERARDGTQPFQEIRAEGGGALAMVWHSRWRVAGYDYREDHKERDRQVYAIRGNWALQKGLMRKGPAGYADEITKPAEEVFCQCTGQWLYSLRALPRDMLTDKGIEELARVRKQLATGGN